MAYAGKLTYKTELDTSGVQKAGSTVKSIIAGLGITKMISMAMSEITNSIDGAIARYDTLNNFPKVMSNLGIASEEADKSIKKMSDKLSGLPTTLDQGAMAVQRFTSKNSDVEKSTDIFLALNNALLAGGASMEIQSTALEQISQSYAKGKPDMMEWRSIQTAMPAQLNQISKAILGNKDSLDGFLKKAKEYQQKNPMSSTATELIQQLEAVKDGTGDMTTTLGTALRTGIISMDDFTDTIIKLNEEGIDGFANFEEQARNSTGGIATSITVAKTQVVKGVTDLITALNDGLQEANLPSISEIIASIGRKAKEVLDKVASRLPSVINFAINLYKAIQPMLPIIEAFGAGILAIVVAYTAYQKIMTIVTAVQTAFNFVMAMNPIGLIVLAIVGLIAILVVLWNKSETFRNIVLGIFEAIKNAFNTVVVVVKTIIDMIVSYFQFWLSVWQTVINTIRNLISNFINFVRTVPSKIISFFTSLPSQMANVGLNIVKGIGNGITNGISWIKNKIKSFVGNVTSFIKKIFKIGSPSKLMEDEVGQWLPKGIAVGIDANADSVTDAMDDMYKEMNKTIKMENSKMNFDVISGDVYNKSFFQTPVAINVQADVEMDSQKVGRLVTPAVTKTIKTGGGI